MEYYYRVAYYRTTFHNVFSQHWPIKDNYISCFLLICLEGHKKISLMLLLWVTANCVTSWGHKCQVIYNSTLFSKKVEPVGTRRLKCFRSVPDRIWALLGRESVRVWLHPTFESQSIQQPVVLCDQFWGIRLDMYADTVANNSSRP